MLSGWEVMEGDRVKNDGALRSGSPPAYTPRRSGRFDKLGVLSTLNAAPPLPSPAITPRMGPGEAHRSPSLAPNRGDVSAFTPGHSLLPPTHSPPDNNRSAALDRSSWLPSPRQSFRFGGNMSVLQGADMSVLDGSTLAKHQVLETQEPEFISKLENSLIQVGPGSRRHVPSAPRLPLLARPPAPGPGHRRGQRG
jgi:hypothetical protein